MNVRYKLTKALRYLRFVRSLILEQIPEKAAGTLRSLSQTALRVTGFLIPVLVTFSLTIMIYTVGFEDVYQQHMEAYTAHHYNLLLLSALFTIRFLIMLPEVQRWRARFFNILLIALVFYLKEITTEIAVLEPGSNELLAKKLVLFAGIVVLFFTEVSHILRFIYRRGANPALLFAGSFIAIIIIGGFLLLLPNATTDSIHPLDAFFTAVSAVCVTGLVVVDTGTAFTTTGQVIILLLIQLGGLGIMTFAGLIGFMVTGSVSLQSQLALKDMLSSSRMSNVISFIARVVIVTFTFEAVGAFMIYSTLPDGMFESDLQKIFYSVFHSVSAFCNAGMSTVTDGLYDGRLRFNYGLHWIIGILVVLGGIGFPVVFNIFTYIRIKVLNILKRIIRDPQKESYTNILQTTSKLSLVTYFILLIIGFVSFFLFEYNDSLHEHSTAFGKITTSFFAGSISPRTSGFNTIDLTSLSLPTMMIYLLLMWIGASPGSTGGGIKTTVAAVAFLNMRSIIVRHERIEVFKSEISPASVKQAFAIILLSLLILGISTLLLSVYDSKHGLLKLAFESFSAFSTVGVSQGITASLSALGKIVLMATMFIGRIGALTLLFAFVTKSDARPYRYPSENIMF